MTDLWCFYVVRASRQGETVGTIHGDKAKPRTGDISEEGATWRTSSLVSRKLLSRADKLHRSTMRRPIAVKL